MASAARDALKKAFTSEQEEFRGSILAFTGVKLWLEISLACKSP